MKKGFFLLLVGSLIFVLNTPLLAQKHMPSNDKDMQMVIETITFNLPNHQKINKFIKGINKPDQATSIHYFFPEVNYQKAFSPHFVFFKILNFVGFLFLALLVVIFFEKYLFKVAHVIEKKPWYSFFMGLLGLVLIVPIALLLVISIIGIFLIPIEVITILLMFLLGYISFAYLLGHKIFVHLKKQDSLAIWKVLIGVTVLWFICWIPIIGWLIKLIIMILGFGGVITSFLLKEKH